MPSLVVVALSPACLPLAGQMFGIDRVELPHRGFGAWQARCGSPSWNAEMDVSLATQTWPEVLAIHATPAAELLDMLSVAWPDARFLLLVQEPAMALASELPLPAGVDIEAWSERQRAVTQQMIRHLQRHPARSLCLLADELPVAPGAAQDLFQARLDLSVEVWKHPLTLPHPPLLSLALARMLLAPERRLGVVAAELLAACPPLAAAPCTSDLATLDRSQLVAEWSTLSKLADEAPGLHVRVEALEQRIGELHDALTGSERKRAESESQLTLLRAELDAVERRSAALQSSLEQARSALDQAAHEARALATAQAYATQLAAEVERLANENEMLAAARVETASASAALPPASASEDITAMCRENELLLVHLHQAQEELEQVFLERQSLALRPGGAGGPLAFGGCEVQHIRDTPPHLELELQLRDVQCTDQPAFDQLRLRLVEHNGNPGIVFIGDPRQPRQFLASWVETGREGSMPYMLVVPSDTVGQALLRRLPTSDWDALAALANGLAGQLSSESTTELSAWPGIARQLADQLAELPHRLRYDELGVEVGERGYQVRFGNLVFGERRFRQFQLQWRPDDARPLALLAPEDDRVRAALDRWPRSGTTGRAPSFALPVGRLGPWALRRQWARLTPADCSMLLAVLDALPAVVHAAQASGTIDGGPADRLRGDAKRLLRQALTASGRQEPLWRRVIRRLRARSP